MGDSKGRQSASGQTPETGVPAITSDIPVEEPIDVSELGHRKEKALAALMSEHTIERAARAAGVSERTLHRWLDEPDFVALYRKLRRQAFNQAISMSQRFASSAIATLAKVMAEPAAPWNAKVSAATALLRFGREGIELEDLQMRLEELERVAGIDNGTPRVRVAGRDDPWKV